jgi:hypothetical protein
MTVAIIIILVELALLVIAGFIIKGLYDQGRAERFAHEKAIAAHSAMIAEKRAELAKLKGAIDDTKNENLAAVSGVDPDSNFNASLGVLQNLSGNRKRKSPAAGN